jgi:hypothetical protein
MTRVYSSKDNKKINILADHVTTQSGNFKGICVSACLSYLGIEPNQYKFTWSKKTGNKAVASILRRFGWSVRSRNSTLIKGTKTVGAVRKAIREYQDYTNDVLYYIHVSGHVLLLNSNGETVVDTDSRKVDRRRVLNVHAVFKK